MYPVTSEFNTKIKLRDREVLGKVQIDYTDPYLDQSITYSTSENANVSHPYQVYDGIKIPYGKYLSLDGSCSLDGSYMLSPATPQQAYLQEMGWWGDQLADVSGDFTSPFPTLRVHFQNRVISKLQTVGDSKRKEYPVGFEINLYDASMTLLYQETVVGNNNIFWEKILETSITQVVTMELVLFKWSHPGRQAKIVELFTSVSEIYSDQDGLISLSLLEEMEIDSGGLSFGNVSTNEITIELDNSDGKFHQGNTFSPLYNMLKPNRRIRAWLGINKDDLAQEWVPLGIFWSGDWNTPDDSVYVKTVGKDRVEFLKSTPYSTTGVLANVTLYDLVEEVFVQAGMSDDEYWIDEDLMDYTIPYVYYNNIPSTDVLRQAAQVCLGHIYCDRGGIIRVESAQQIIDLYSQSVNETANISYPEQTTNEVLDPTYKYASLDGSWILDDEYALPPIDGEYEMGWWGAQLADIDGYFTEPNPTLTLTFYTKSIGAVQVIGDSLRGEYPVDFDIIVYDMSDTVLSHQVVVGNTLVVSETNIPENPTNAVKLDLVVKRWSHPGHQVKILELIDRPYRLEITPEDYFRKDNPAQYTDVANIVEVIPQVMDAVGNTSEGTKVTVQDTDSITELGPRKFVFPSNSLIQTTAMATEVAEKVLANQKASNRNLDLTWRGHPALMLGNEITVHDKLQQNSYKVIRQTLDYDGGLRCNLTGRKVVE